MTEARLPDLLADARSDGVALGSFNVIALEHAEAIVEGAERAGAPVVLQLSQNTVAYHRALEPVAAACLAIARAAEVPAVVHLDHATDRALVEDAVRLGISSVMFDASTLGHEANLAATREVVQWCHERGVAVEAELGEVGGKDGVHAPGARTDPAEAAAYVASTRVDALAVAVGSSHAMLTKDAVLDDALIAAIADRVEVPLVLHGSSGVPDAGLTSAIRHGITKVNLATTLNASLTAAVRTALAADPALVDPRKYLGPGRDAVAAEVTRLLAVLRPGA
jgi:fructose-bisphosphate aldolase class II